VEGTKPRIRVAAGSVIADRYLLTRPVGAGAASAVFEAETSAGEKVALKALASTRGLRDHDERCARFAREAAICAKLDHRHVAKVLDHGVDARTDTPYLVMPLFDGTDLGAVLDRLGPLDPDAAAVVFIQACRGVGAAHAAGVVHRDVKPSNLLLVRAEGGYLVKVADFGIAKMHEPRLETFTTTGRFMGTPHYVSPEQAVSAKTADHRSDVWSLAMSLYHALAGKPAFAGVGNFMALVLELTGRDVPALQLAAPWVAPELARVVHGALLRDLDLRCPSAFELELALTTVLGVDRIEVPLPEDDLAPVAYARRVKVAPRAQLPESWEELLRK
jgi:serine/threonine-protein kinase